MKRIIIKYFVLISAFNINIANALSIDHNPSIGEGFIKLLLYILSILTIITFFNLFYRLIIYLVSYIDTKDKDKKKLVNSKDRFLRSIIILLLFSVATYFVKIFEDELYVIIDNLIL